MFDYYRLKFNSISKYVLIGLGYLVIIKLYNFIGGKYFRNV